MSVFGNYATYPSLGNQIALVFGIGQEEEPDHGNWGNGAATAVLLAANGVKVFGCDISLRAAEPVAAYIRSRGGICDVRRADATESTDVEVTVATVMEKYGRIDILVNNVGATKKGDPSSMDMKTWESQLKLNLTSVFLSCHFVLPIMEAQGAGAVVNNASIAGMRYIGKDQVAYAVSKAGVIQFTKHTAALYASKGVRLNCVAPGLMMTSLVDKLKVSTNDSDQEAYRKIKEHNVPMGSMGRALNVASAVAFLVSEASAYITGEVIVIDGGLSVSTGTGSKL